MQARRYERTGARRDTRAGVTTVRCRPGLWNKAQGAEAGDRHLRWSTLPSPYGRFTGAGVILWKAARLDVPALREEGVRRDFLKAEGETFVIFLKVLVK